MKRYFISDLHLTPERPDITRAFLSFMDTTANDADELYLLGDIFEAWIGDDGGINAYQPIINSLRKASLSTTLFFQHGNRDFLIGDDFVQATGCTLLPPAYVVNLPTGNALLMHGDQLCVDDKDYQSFRSMVRSPDWQAAFLGQSIEKRFMLAKQMRETSKQKGAEKSNDIMDVNLDAVRETLLEYKVDTLIHGHTHRPAVHLDQISTGLGTRIVLGDWDTHLWYLVSDATSLTLIDEPITA
jgi:UDP-2,3-diacylglucosamine hydrolase